MTLKGKHNREKYIPWLPYPKEKLHGVSWERIWASTFYSRRLSRGTSADDDLLVPQSGLCSKPLDYTECPTPYRTLHFFNNFTTNEDIATKFEANLPHCVRNVTTS